MLTKFRRTFRLHTTQRDTLLAIGIIIVFGITGSVLLFTSHAATPTASIQPENGTASINASKIADTTASGGQVIQFGSGVSGGTQTNNCIPSPHLCGYPDATTTGYTTGTQLTSSGSITISTAGQTVTDKDITGCVTITASNVTFKNSRIRSNPSCRAGLYIPNGATGVKIDHVEIDGGRQDDGTNGPVPGFYGWGFTATFMNIHDTGDAVDIESGDIITDSYIHNLYFANGSHTDGVQATDGSNMTMRHNTIIATGTNVNEGIIMGADLGNISGAYIDNNILDGGNNAIVAGNNPGYTATNINITNNRFGRVAQYGPCNFNITPVFTGNVYDDTGAKLSC